jgi:tripartite ATP-independent transporter DctP family solute receptor
MKLLKAIGLTASSIAALAVATTAFAADVTLKIGVVTPTAHPHSQSAHEFARLVGEKTNGEVEVKVFDNGSIGNNKELLKDVRSGTVDFTISTPGVMATYSPMPGILELPYIFSSKEHMMAVTRGDIGEKIAATYKEAARIEILGYMGGAQRNMITTEAAIKTIDDLKGLKMRTWSWKVMLDWWSGLGANGSVVPFPEVYTALQTGVVDGAENEFSSFTSARWAEVAKNISLTQHSITVRPLVGSVAKLSRLSKAHQEAIHAAALEAADFDVALEGKLDMENMEKLKADYGVTYTTPEKAPLIEASQKVIDEFAKDKGLEDLAAQIKAAAK